MTTLVRIELVGLLVTVILLGWARRRGAVNGRHVSVATAAYMALVAATFVLYVWTDPPGQWPPTSGACVFALFAAALAGSGQYVIAEWLNKEWEKGK